MGSVYDADNDNNRSGQNMDIRELEYEMFLEVYICYVTFSTRPMTLPWVSGNATMSSEYSSIISMPRSSQYRLKKNLEGGNW